MTIPQRPGRLRGGIRWTAAALFVAVVSALAAAPLLGPKPTARQFREQLLMELRPVALGNCTLRRFGSANDGGYLLCENLLGNVQSAYSYGIGPTDDWGCEVSQVYGVPVHQYDCFSPPVAACPSGRSVFHDECISRRAETIDSRIFDTLTRQIAKNGDVGKTLLAKIDVEGAELESLLATSDRVLDRIDQLAMEIHGTDKPVPAARPEVEADVPSGPPALQQPGVLRQVPTLAGLGLPGAARQQADWRRRSGGGAAHAATCPGCTGLRDGPRLPDSRTDRAVVLAEGLRPSDSPTRGLARRSAGALPPSLKLRRTRRSLGGGGPLAGSLAWLARFLE